MSEEFPKKENKLETFKKEVAMLKKEEEENVNENGFRKKVHFEQINPEELDEAGRLIYELFLDKQLTLEAFNVYRDQLEKTGNQSQKQFAAYIANMLFIQMYKDKI